MDLCVTFANNRDWFDISPRRVAANAVEFFWACSRLPATTLEYLWTCSWAWLHLSLSLSLAHFNYPNYYIINGKILSKLHSCPFWPSSFFFCLQVRSNPVSNPETLFSVSLFVLLQHLLLLLWLLPVLLLMDCLLKIILCCKTSSFLYDVVQAKHVRPGIRALMKKLVHRLLILMLSLCIVSGFVLFCFVFVFLIVHFCLILWVSVISGEWIGGIVENCGAVMAKVSRAIIEAYWWIDCGWENYRSS